MEYNLSSRLRRGVAGVDDLGPQQRLGPVLAFPLTALHDPHELPHDRTVPEARAGGRLHLGRYAGHVGEDPQRVGGGVVLYLDLRAALGAEQLDAEVVAGRTERGPAGLQLQRAAALEPQVRRRQVLDLELRTERVDG